MKGSSTSGLLIAIGFILYLIIQIGFYVLIILAVVGIIALIVSVSKGTQATSVNHSAPTIPKAIPSSTYHQDKKIVSESQHKQLKALIAAHGESPATDTSQMIIAVLKLVEKFYTTHAYIRIDLFDYIIESVNEKLKCIEPRRINGKVAKRFEGILYEIEALKGHIAPKIIVEGYNLKFNQSSIDTDNIVDEHNELAKNHIIEESARVWGVTETERISMESEGYIFTTREALRQEEVTKRKVQSDEEERLRKAEIARVIEFERKTRLIKERRSKRQEEFATEIYSNQRNAEVSSENDNTTIKIEVVPYWQHYYVYTADGLTNASTSQREFYDAFKRNFLNGVYLDIEGNYNYAFILLFDLIDDYKKDKDLEKVQNALTALGEHYPKTAQYTKASLNKAIRADVVPKQADHAINNIDVSSIAQGAHRTTSNLKTEKRVQKCKWIPYGEAVEVNGVKLSRGGFYLGEKYLIPKQYRNSYWYNNIDYAIEPIINPKLEVINGDNEITIFSGYQDMRPALRGHYLRWLAKDIDDENIPAELFNLYLFGLELRMFIDKETTNVEREHILKDVIRFKEIFKDYHNCRYLLSDFIDSTITKYFNTNPLDFVSQEELNEFRTYRSYVINNHMTDNSLDCQAAYGLCKLFYAYHNIPSKFEDVALQMFSETFAKKHKTGLSVRECDNSISYRIGENRFVHDVRYMYKSATSSYYHLREEILKVNFSSWDIESALRECNDILYRGFYGYNKALRDNHGQETLEAIFLLPRIIDVSSYPKIVDLNSFLISSFSNSKYPIVDVNSLLGLWDCPLGETSLPKRIINSIQNAFDEMGYGVEPDYRVHGGRFKQDDKCILFTKTRKSPIEPDNLYARMQATIKMAVILAQADGEISDAERLYTLKYIAEQEGNPNKIKYLSAHFEYLSLSKQKFIGFKQYPLIFDRQSIESTHNFLIKLGCADGEINNKEVEVITKIMGYFDIDCSDIHSKIHRIFTGEDDIPILVAKGSGATSYIIPSPEEIRPEFSIDMYKLLQIEQDTKKSKVILSDIFVPEDDFEKPAISSQQNKLLAILEVLLTKDSWNRADVAALCSQYNLMIGFVLESLNETSYTVVDDAVIDDDGDTIYVTTQYKDQLICRNQ